MIVCLGVADCVFQLADKFGFGVGLVCVWLVLLIGFVAWCPVDDSDVFGGLVVLGIDADVSTWDCV